MKRVVVWIVSLAFIFCVMACAGDQTPPGTSRSEPVNVPTVRVVKMRATGRVVDVTDTTLKIERTVKGTKEPFEFALEKPLTNIKVGNKVLVRYITKEDKNVVTRITKQGLKLRKKIVQQKEKKENIISLEWEFLKDMFSVNNHG